MTEKVSVNISGTAFSLLLYENSRSNQNQEGFLLGEVVTHRKRTITDQDQEVINIEHIIKVNSVIPCPKLRYFYNSSGKINEDLLKKFLGPDRDSVVSWYIFKHTSSFKLTLRERIITKQVANYFMPHNPEMFTCALLTAEVGSEAESTHIFSQTFLRYSKSTFHTLPMHIINLKDSHDTYRTPEKCSPMFQQLVKSAKLDSGIKDGYSTITQIEVALDERTAKVVRELSNEEKKLNLLQKEFLSLSDALAAKKTFKETTEVEAAEEKTPSPVKKQPKRM